MTFQLHTFYCRRCHAATPHETGEDGQHARCVNCLDQQRKLDPGREQFSATNRHLAALDGYGNRGEQPPRVALQKGESK